MSNRLKEGILGDIIEFLVTVGASVAVAEWFKTHGPKMIEHRIKKFTGKHRAEVWNFIRKLEHDDAREGWARQIARALAQDEDDPGFENRFWNSWAELLYSLKEEDRVEAFVDLGCMLDADFDATRECLTEDRFKKLLRKINKNVLKPVGRQLVRVGTQLTNEDSEMADAFRRFRANHGTGLLTPRDGAPIGRFSALRETWEMFRDFLANINGAMRMAVYVTVLGALGLYFMFLGGKYLVGGPTARFILSGIVLLLIVAFVFAAMGRIQPLGVVVAYQVEFFKKGVRILWTSLAVAVMLAVYALLVPIEAWPSLAPLVPIGVSLLLILWFSYDSKFFRRTAPALTAFGLVVLTVLFIAAKVAPDAMGEGLSASSSEINRSLTTLFKGGEAEQITVDQTPTEHLVTAGHKINFRPIDGVIEIHNPCNQRTIEKDSQEHKYEMVDGKRKRVLSVGDCDTYEIRAKDKSQIQVAIALTPY